MKNILLFRYVSLLLGHVNVNDYKCGVRSQGPNQPLSTLHSMYRLAICQLESISRISGFSQHFKIEWIVFYDHPNSGGFTLTPEAIYA